MSTVIMMALAPIIMILISFYILDKYNREPLGLMLKLLLFGMLSVIIILPLESFLSALNIFDGDTFNLYVAFIVAAFSEEFVKWLIVYKFTYSSIFFDEKMDGIMYAVFVSMGFAAIENILYVASSGFTVAILRALTAVPAHMMFGVAMGYYLSLEKFSNRHNKKIIRMSLLIPILFHGIYDYILMSNYHLLLLLFIPFMIFMIIFSFKKTKKFITESKAEVSY